MTHSLFLYFSMPVSTWKRQQILCKALLMLQVSVKVTEKLRLLMKFICPILDSILLMSQESSFSLCRALTLYCRNDPYSCGLPLYLAPCEARLVFQLAVLVTCFATGYLLSPPAYWIGLAQINKVILKGHKLQ